MTMIILPNELFDDGGLECKTFCIATREDSLVCEFKYIEKTMYMHVDAIKEAISQGKQYISIGRLSDASYMEIQWD